MSGRTTIEWTDSTWNPVRGCVKISPGCDHCYAERFAERWRGLPNHPYGQGFDPLLVPERLIDPLRWVRPRMVFVNSMSDLFQAAVSFPFARLVFEVMRQANWHTYQILTKRAGRMRKFVDSLDFDLETHSHIWLGVSVENQRHGFARVRHLTRTPAAVRFLSVEPLLEDIGPIQLGGIHWVIVGGESGPGARLIEDSWVRQIREQCHRAHVPFFFKQWGGTQKSLTGRSLDGRTHDEMPTAGRRLVPDLAERRRRIELVEELISNWRGSEFER